MRRHVEKTFQSMKFSLRGVRGKVSPPWDNAEVGCGAQGRSLSLGLSQRHSPSSHRFSLDRLLPSKGSSKMELVSRSLMVFKYVALFSIPSCCSSGRDNKRRGVGRGGDRKQTVGGNRNEWIEQGIHPATLSLNIGTLSSLTGGIYWVLRTPTSPPPIPPCLERPRSFGPF